MDREREEFEGFWRAFPRKVARVDAWKAWQQTRAVRPPLAVLVAAIGTYVAWRARLADRRDFVPALLYPATWLRQERWADEFDASASRTAPAPVVIDPAEQARRDAERIATMRARAAWGDVRGSLVHRSVPLGGWPDPRTAVALDAIGGFARICRVASRGELDSLSLQFERAYLDAEERAKPVTLQLVRGAS